MDKLRRVLSGQEDNEERGLTEQVDSVWHLRSNALMLTSLEKPTFFKARLIFFLLHNIQLLYQQIKYMYNSIPPWLYALKWLVES